MNIAIVIPSLNPPWKSVGYVTDLLEKNLSPIILVNDGSQKEHHSTFSEIWNLENFTVLTHETNKRTRI